MPKEAQDPAVKTIAVPIDKTRDGLETMLEEQERMKKTKGTVGMVYGVLVLLGVVTGYLLHASLVKGGVPGLPSAKVTMTKTDKVVGLTDTSTFKDWAEGTLEKGSVDGEGTHKLIREGGPSQTAALVSSVLDLDEYVGKKVKVWGQTYPPKKAGWFMDVGKIEIE